MKFNVIRITDFGFLDYLAVFEANKNIPKL
jgi:hypothetical protein